MALSITESWQSGDGSLGKDSSDEYNAIVRGTEADNADDPYVVSIFAALHFSLISECNNLLNSLRRKRIAPFTWLFTADYKSATLDRQTNDASFSFSTGGGTQHITTSIQTVNSYNTAVGAFSGSNLPAPDHGGSIGVQEDGTAAGVDIDIGAFEFKTTFYVAPAKMTADYVQLLYQLSGKVNNDSVTVTVDGINLQFDPGELKFRFAEGSKRVGFGDWELTLNWAGNPNLRNYQFGPFQDKDGTPGGIDKDGWDYLWTTNAPIVDPAAKALVHPPQNAYVERVYIRQPLSPLLLATSFGQSNTQPWGAPDEGEGGGVND